MFGEGQRCVSAEASTNSRALVICNSSATQIDQSYHYIVAKEENVESEACSKQTEPTSNHSQKLQDDLQELGQKIKHHDDNVKYLKSLINKIDESILDMRVAIGKYYTRSSSEIEDPSSVNSEETIIQNILKHEGSAAALFYNIKHEPEKLNLLPWTKDVIGVVATLGKVDNDNLSRLLSEYLGLDTMLAVVCKTFEGVKALQAYNIEGMMNKNLGIHAFGASAGRSLNSQCLVISIENFRPYVGECIADDPQQRLDLPKPKLINGEIIPGFLGFAVNMITIDRTHLYCVSNDGHNLRKTLFYNLFSNVQVYRSREDMLKALPFIPKGAVSLDGGIIKSTGVYVLGQRKEGVDVTFPNNADRFNLPEPYFEIENRMKETGWKKNRTLEDLTTEQSLLDAARFSYERKKQEFVQFLARRSSLACQRQVGM